jgi:hypothetical protein
MPSSHRRDGDWTPERIKRKASEIGPKTAALVDIILCEHAHLEQGSRSCIGILRHTKSFGAERLEAACNRALDAAGQQVDDDGQTSHPWRVQTWLISAPTSHRGNSAVKSWQSRFGATDKP